MRLYCARTERCGRKRMAEKIKTKTVSRQENCIKPPAFTSLRVLIAGDVFYRVSQHKSAFNGNALEHVEGAVFYLFK